MFFDTLWPDGLHGNKLTVWELNSKSSRFFDDAQSAKQYADSIADTNNVYFGVGLIKEALSGGRRGKAEDVSAIPGLWADIDYSDQNAHKKGDLPSPEEAWDLLNGLAYKPSIIVNSGFGYHAYWLFDEPWFFANDTERSEAANLLASWGAWLQSQSDWKLDSVYDLPRILRIPGTYNHKHGKREVTVLDQNTRRYDRKIIQSAIEGIANEISGPSKLASKPKDDSDFRKPAKEGERNVRMTRFAGDLFGNWDGTAEDSEEILTKLREENKLNEPPLPDSEILATWKSIRGREEGQRARARKTKLDPGFMKWFDEQFGAEGKTISIIRSGPSQKSPIQFRFEGNNNTLYEATAEGMQNRGCTKTIRAMKLVAPFLSPVFGKTEWDAVVSKIAMNAAVLVHMGEIVESALIEYIGTMSGAAKKEIIRESDGSILFFAGKFFSAMRLNGSLQGQKLTEVVNEFPGLGLVQSENKGRPAWRILPGSHISDLLQQESQEPTDEEEENDG